MNKTLSFSSLELGHIGSKLIKELNNKGYEVKASTSKEPNRHHPIKIRHQIEDEQIIISINLTLKKKIKSNEH